MRSETTLLGNLRRLNFGKAWNRNFVGREFCNTFVLIRDSGFCLCVKKSLQRINPNFCSNQLYKTVRLIANYFLSRNKIKFRHSFVSAQVFGLLSSTGPLGFPNKVCDTSIALKVKRSLLPTSVQFFYFRPNLKV